jgi:glutamate decarboxylase
MIIQDLEEKIAIAKREGGHPFLVAATAGTTVLGSFDPFDEIANVCEKNNMWFHVDVSMASDESLFREL